MPMHDFLTRVMERAGFEDLEEARRCASVVLGEVGHTLSQAEHDAVRDELPAELMALWGAPERRSFGVAQLVAAIGAREGVTDGFALEHCTVVGEAVARALRPEALRRLRDALPQDLGELFTPRPDAPPVERVHLDPSRRTLAEGRSGGARPLYAGRADNAHSESVARAENPHGDTKLSSTRGLTQEREEETLATGKPGSTRPVSTTRR